MDQSIFKVHRPIADGLRAVLLNNNRTHAENVAIVHAFEQIEDVLVRIKIDSLYTRHIQGDIFGAAQVQEEMRRLPKILVSIGCVILFVPIGESIDYLL